MLIAIELSAKIGTHEIPKCKAYSVRVKIYSVTYITNGELQSKVLSEISIAEYYEGG